MADIFISYKSERRNAAEHLAEILTDWGYTVWWDYSLVAGVNYTQEIQRELWNAQAVIVLWCGHSVKSEWVHAEAMFAHKNGNKLVPAWIETSVIPLPFNILHTVDLLGWDGGPRSPHLRELMRQLASKIGREPVANEAGLDRVERIWKRCGAPPLSQFTLGQAVEPTGFPPARMAFEAPVQDIPPPPQHTEQLPPRVPVSSSLTFVNVPSGPCFWSFSREQIALIERLVRDKYPRYDAGRVADIMKKQPASQVDVPAFSISATPVTNAAFAEFVEATGYVTHAEKRGEGNNWRSLRDQLDHPVVYVTFDDARAFCAWNKSALPTVEQWVRACRGDDRRIYPWGDAFNPARCNTNESCPGECTTPVRRFESGKSPFGCYDLVGNVEEWTAGSDSGYYAVLGGSYADSCAVQGLPIANLYSDPSRLSSDRGFRCVRPQASSR